MTPTCVKAVCHNNVPTKANNAIDLRCKSGVNSSFRKGTKKGAFPNENALLKVLYLRVKQLQNKWNGGHIRNWSMVLNQLMVNDKFAKRIEKYSIYLP